MDQTVMMAMQLCEEYSKRRREGVTLNEEEALTYNQLLRSVAAWMKLAERRIDSEITTGEPDEEGGSLAGRD